jgi:hypothetical protein
MKIIADTGYLAGAGGRCYYVSNRVINFDAETTKEEIQAFVDAEKEAWYGQEFSARIEDKRVHIRRGIDSGD